MKSTRSILKIGIKLGVAIVLIFFLLQMIDWRKSWDIAQSISIESILIYVTLLVLGVGISAKKWEILAHFNGYRFPFFSYFRWYLAGTFINNFLPSVVGGDTYRALVLGKKEGSRVHAVSSVIFDRYTGLVSMAILAVLFSLGNFSLVRENIFWLLLFFGAFLGILAQGLLLPGKKWSLFSFIFKFLPKKAEKVAESIEEYKDKRIITLSFLWGALFSFFGVGLVNYVLFSSVGVSLHFLDFLSVIFFINIIAAIPLSVNNIGIKEWAYYIFFGYFGVDPEISVTVALVSRFLQMGVSLFALPTVLAFSKERRSGTIKELFNENEDLEKRA